MILSIIILSLIVSACPIFSQEVFRSSRITVTLNNTETESVYFGFQGDGGGQHGFTATAIDPHDKIFTSGDITFDFRIDSTSASTESDSLSAYALPLTNDGFIKSDTLWFDFANFTTSTSQQWTAWEPFNRIGTGVGLTRILTVSLSGKYDPCFGFKINIQQAASGGMISDVTIDAVEVK